MMIYFITYDGQQKACKLPEDFNFFEFSELIEKTFGESALTNSRFICMGQELKLKEKFTFEHQKKMIRNGSIIFENLRKKMNVQNEQDLLTTEETSIFQSFYIIVSLLFMLVFCFSDY